MLKTLRITSLVALIVTALGVIVTVILGFKGDPDIQGLLDQPGVTAKYTGAADKASKKADDVHPLVNQAKLFALRINPPPPPPPPKPKEPAVQPKQPQLARQASIAQPVAPPPITNFEVLATVCYASNPAKSLVLLKSGAKIEWFRQGEKAGHLNIDEVRDGSVVFSQGGRNQQILKVPAKSWKSLLKSDTAVADAVQPVTRPSVNPTIASRERLRSETVQPAVMTAEQEPPAAEIAANVPVEPPQPTPEQRIQELDSTVAGIQDIINRQDETMSAEDRKAESEMWKGVLDALKSEKASLEAAKGNPAVEANASEPPATPTPQPQPTEPASTNSRPRRVIRRSAASNTPPTSQPANAPAAEAGPTDEGQGQTPAPESVPVPEESSQANAASGESAVPEVAPGPAGEVPPNEY